MPCLNIGAERAKGAEDPLVVRVVRTERDPEIAADHERHFQSIDRVETQTVAEKRRFGIDGLGGHLELQGRDETLGHIVLERRLHHGRGVRIHEYSNGEPDLSALLPRPRPDAKRATTGSALLITSVLLDHLLPVRPLTAASILAIQALGLALVTGRLVLCCVLAVLLAPAVLRWPQEARIADAVLIYAAALGAPLIAFSATLRPGAEPLVSSLARRVHGALRLDVARYTRWLTGIWCGFFAASLLAPVVLLVTGPAGAWRWPMNGGALAAAAVLVLTEYPIRRTVIRDFDHASFAQSVATFRARNAEASRDRGADA